MFHSNSTRSFFPVATSILSAREIGTAVLPHYDLSNVLDCQFFSSGINHADWLMGMAPVKEDGVTKAYLWHLFPKSSAEIENNWDVSGLRATGSYQFSVEALAIPEDHAIAIEVRDDDPPLYQIPMNLSRVDMAAGFK